jgi:exopolyphosphatase/pppGpp-phosphohydrolase
MKKKLRIKKIVSIIITSLLFSISSYSQKNLFAGIEIGSKGVKITVVEIRNIKKGKYKIKSHWSENVAIVKGISIDNKLAQEDIDNAGFVVQKNLERIKKEYEITDDRIFIVGSSGVAMASNRNDLVNKIKSLTNKRLDFIGSDTEGLMLLKGTIPPSKYKNSISLDIGGGNTKGGYIDTNNNFEFTPLSLSYGTITLTQAINKTITDDKDNNDIIIYQEKLKEFTPILNEQIKEILYSKSIPLYKKNIYLSGGAVWAFNTLYYNTQTDDPFIPLNLKDIQNYNVVIKNNYDKYKLLASKNENINRVLNTYDQKHLISANTLLISCLESIPDIQNKNIFFAKEGQIAWLISYIVDRSKRVKK